MKKLLSTVLIILLFPNCGMSQDEVDLTMIYDQIVDEKKIEKTIHLRDVTPKQKGLYSLLPNLDENLFIGWERNGEPIEWKTGKPELEEINDAYYKELGIKSYIKQNYLKESEQVAIEIFEMKNSKSAFSLYTTSQKEKSSSLALGRKVSESDTGIVFWKSNFIVKITIPVTDIETKHSRHFSVLASQEISRSLNGKSNFPVSYLQIPSLNRISGSEVFCSGEACFSKYLYDSDNLEVDLEILSIARSKESVKARYSSTVEEEKVNADLVYISYENNDVAKEVFKTVNAYYENLKEKLDSKESEDKSLKDIKVENDGELLEIRREFQDSDKEEATLVQIKENVIAITTNLRNIDYGKKILDLIY